MGLATTCSSGSQAESNGTLSIGTVMGVSTPARSSILRISFTLLLALFSMQTLESLAQSKTQSDSSRALIRHGDKGFELRTLDNKFLLQLQGRLQFRFATPADTDPITYDDFVGDRKPVFKINRARLKIGGHAFEPWLTYYWEYEL